MPRLPRLDLPDIAQHVIQRGNDRQPCLFTPDDYRRYLHDLNEIALLEGCAIHAYVLMTNHVHLLVPPVDRGCVGRMMQALGRRHVRHVNQIRHRTGTLQEDRYSLIPFGLRDRIGFRAADKRVACHRQRRVFDPIRLRRSRQRRG